MKKILFVCTGNTCRSIMAEALFMNIIKKDADIAGEYTAGSAGISAAAGQPPSGGAVRVLRNRWGIEISHLGSKQLTQSDIDESWLILAMTEAHRDFIVSKWKNAADKTYTLGQDIADPFGMPDDYYEKCSEDIMEAAESLVSRLKSEGASFFDSSGPLL